MTALTLPSFIIPDDQLVAVERAIPSATYAACVAKQEEYRRITTTPSESEYRLRACLEGMAAAEQDLASSEQNKAKLVHGHYRNYSSQTLLESYFHHRNPPNRFAGAIGWRLIPGLVEICHCVDDPQLLIRANERLAVWLPKADRVSILLAQMDRGFSCRMSIERIVRPVLDDGWDLVNLTLLDIVRVAPEAVVWFETLNVRHLGRFMDRFAELLELRRGQLIAEGKENIAAEMMKA